MPATPPVNTQLTARLGADWLEEPFYFYVGNTGAQDDFSGCSIVGGIYLNGIQKVDLGSATTGYTSITQPNRVDIKVPQAVLDALGLGVFSVSLSLVTTGDQTQDLLDFSLKVSSP